MSTPGHNHPDTDATTFGCDGCRYEAATVTERAEWDSTPLRDCLVTFHRPFNRTLTIPIALRTPTGWPVAKIDDWNGKIIGRALLDWATKHDPVIADPYDDNPWLKAPITTIAAADLGGNA